MTPPGRGDHGDLLSQGEWSEYRRLIITELTRINQTLEAIRGELSVAKTDIALLQLKASAWGAISGAVVAIGVLLMRYVPT